MILLIDNYDSFTFNLVQFLGEIGVPCTTLRNDAQSASDILADPPQAIVLSPGPGRPEAAGVCIELLRTAPPDLPILGICLGCQAIGYAFGGTIISAPQIMHGKLSAIHHTNTALFANVPSPFQATRYHSLAVDADNLPDTLIITAHSADSLMGLQHKERPVFGLQFHPESIATRAGYQLLANFCSLAKLPHGPLPPPQADILDS